MPMVWLTIPTVEDGVVLKWINSILNWLLVPTPFFVIPRCQLLPSLTSHPLTTSRRRPKPHSHPVVNPQVWSNTLVAVVSQTGSTCPRERKMVWRWYSWPSLKMLNKIRLMTLSLMSIMNLVAPMLTVVSMARKSLMFVLWDTHLIGQLLTSR